MCPDTAARLQGIYREATGSLEYKDPKNHPKWLFSVGAARAQVPKMCARCTTRAPVHTDRSKSPSSDTPRANVPQAAEAMKEQKSDAARKVFVDYMLRPEGENIADTVRIKHALAYLGKQCVGCNPSTHTHTHTATCTPGPAVRRAICHATLLPPVFLAGPVTNRQPSACCCRHLAGPSMSTRTSSRCVCACVRACARAPVRCGHSTTPPPARSARCVRWQSAMPEQPPPLHLGRPCRQRRVSG